MNTTLLLIGACAGWLIREVTALVIRKVATNAGRVGYVREGSGFFAVAELEDGTKQEVRVVDPRVTFRGSLSFRLSIRGQFFNQSGAPKLFTKVQLEFCHPVRAPFLFKNPDVIVNGSSVKAFYIPAQSLAPVRIEIDIPAGQLDEEYSQTLPVIIVGEERGRQHRFRASASSIYGAPMAFWPGVGGGERPVVFDREAANPLNG